MRNTQRVALLALIVAVLLAYFVRAATKLGVWGAVFFLVVAVAAFFYQRSRSKKSSNSESP
jgi:O-antigen/teichoic acid export membrane protein